MLRKNQTLQIIDIVGNDELAKVYIAKTPSGKHLEFVESTPAFLPRSKKWVIVLSVLFGCPIKCSMCDAGSNYQGMLSFEEIFAQIDCLINLRYPDGQINSEQFKIQFARMGDPSLNNSVLDVLEALPNRYRASGLLPSLSTVAPLGCDSFLDNLIDIKNNLYADGKFQMQFSIHTTDHHLRDKIIPANKWDFAKIANYGEKFHSQGGQKITLNFALSKNAIIDPSELKKYFSPEIFMVKITPLNPTVAATTNNLQSYFVNGTEEEDVNHIIPRLQDIGYDVILSVGDLEENQIGSNCGQYVQKYIGNNYETAAKTT